MRKTELVRKTSETEVKVAVNLDGTGIADIDMNIAFCSHMITLLATHSLIDIELRARGDLKHHVVEDTAICLGKAIKRALGDSSGIRRFGYATVPMDCSLASAAVDLSGRPYFKVDLKVENENIEDLPTEDVYHFIETLATSLEANIHIRVHYGTNDHHKVEAALKALALSLRQAVSLDPRRKGIPSSKGVI